MEGAFMKTGKPMQHLHTVNQEIIEFGSPVNNCDVKTVKSTTKPSYTEFTTPVNECNVKQVKSSMKPKESQQLIDYTLSNTENTIEISQNSILRTEKTNKTEGLDSIVRSTYLSEIVKENQDDFNTISNSYIINKTKDS